MDTDVSHAVKAEFDKIHDRIDNLIKHNNLQEPSDTESTETENNEEVGEQS